MTTTYKDYTIVTKTTIHPAGGWSVTVEILALDFKQLVEGINLGPDMTFAMETLAHQAGISLARYWIDART